VKLPFIWLECGSHWYVYVPATNVPVVDDVPVPETLVEMMSPLGPNRWKLCSVPMSLTTTWCSPGSTPLVPSSEIVKPGPTEPFIVWVATPAPGSANAMTAMPMRSQPALITLLYEPNRAADLPRS
jgi:hypothetical protein